MSDADCKRLFHTKIERRTSDSAHRNWVQSSSLNLIAGIGRFGLSDRLLELVGASQLVFGEESLLKDAPFVLGETRSVRGSKKTGED